jgi:hypothetical protein
VVNNEKVVLGLIRVSIERETERELSQRAIKEYRDRKEYMRKNWGDLPFNRLWFAPTITLSMIEAALDEQIDYLRGNPCASGLGILNMIEYCKKLLKNLPAEFETDLTAIKCRKKVAVLEALWKVDPCER